MEWLTNTKLYSLKNFFSLYHLQSQNSAIEPLANRTIQQAMTEALEVTEDENKGIPSFPSFPTSSN